MIIYANDLEKKGAGPVSYSSNEGVMLTGTSHPQESLNNTAYPPSIEYLLTILGVGGREKVDAAKMSIEVPTYMLGTVTSL